MRTESAACGCRHPAGAAAEDGFTAAASGWPTAAAMRKAARRARSGSSSCDCGAPKSTDMPNPEIETTVPRKPPPR